MSLIKYHVVISEIPTLSENIWCTFKDRLHPGGFVLAYSESHKNPVNAEKVGFVIHPTIFILSEQLEMWILAQKPHDTPSQLDGIIQTGAGAFNIEMARIPVDKNDTNKRDSTGGYPDKSDNTSGLTTLPYNHQRGATLVDGRWPSHFMLQHNHSQDTTCHDECPVWQLGYQQPSTYSDGGKMRSGGGIFITEHTREPTHHFYDTGRVDRYFYQGYSRADLIYYASKLFLPPDGYQASIWLATYTLYEVCPEWGAIKYELPD